MTMLVARSEPCQKARGMSLVEVLAVCLIVGVLLSITLPLLSRSKQSAGDARVLANLASHANMIASYCIDYHDRYPQPVEVPLPPYIMSGIPGSDPRIKTDYFAVSMIWNQYLAAPYYSLKADADVFFPPKYPEGLPDVARYPAVSPTPYYLSCSLLASPDYWLPETRTGPGQWGSVRSADVRYPSQKVMLLNSYAWWINMNKRNGAVKNSVGMEIAAVDGHVRAVRVGEIASGYFRGDGQWRSLGALHPVEWIPGLHTLQGARGRDIP